MAELQYGSAFVTFDMLADALVGYRICHVQRPVASNRFQWVSSARWERGVVPERSMVIVCSRSELPETLAQFREALIVITTQHPDEPLPPMRNPTITVVADPSDNLIEKLQNYFLRVLTWQRDASTSASAEDPIGELLRKSGTLAKAPLLLYSADGELQARSAFSTSLPAYRAFMAREREVVNSILMLNKDQLELRSGRGTVCIQATRIGETSGPCGVLVALRESAPTAGEKDFIALLAKHLMARTDRSTRALSTLHRSISTLFDDLAHRRYIGKADLDKYSSLYHFSQDSEFRLLRFRHNDQLARDLSAELIERVRAMNRGKCLVGVYDNDLMVLLHADDLDSSLSTLAIETDIVSMMPLFDGYVAASQVFSDLENFYFAYRQTELIITYRDYIDLSLIFSTDDSNEAKPCYTFEEVLLFALVDSNAMTQEMKDFAFSHTLLEKLIAEDRATGNNDTRILASYLHNERKATLVAEKLHMHRNTVLYRIDKIEKRFGLDLSKEWSRSRVMLDFTIMYCKLMRNDALRTEILGDGL